MTLIETKLGLRVPLYLKNVHIYAYMYALAFNVHWYILEYKQCVSSPTFCSIVEHKRALACISILSDLIDLW